MEEPKLRAERDKLTKLADDLGRMQEHLVKQVTRMDTIVDSIESKWQGPTATEYRRFHREAAKDAVRIKRVMQRLEQAVRLGRDGFSADDLAAMEELRKIQGSVDVMTETNALSTPNTGPGAAAGMPAGAQVPAAPNSRLNDM